MTRRKLLLGATLGTAGLTGYRLLAGGGSLTGQPLTLEFWGGPNSEQRKDQVGAWMAQHPRLKVTFRAVGAAGQGVQSLQAFAAVAAAHTAPHVVDFDRFQVATYVNWKMLRPLDELIKRDKYDLLRFVPAVLAEATGFDKNLYGLPNSVDTRLFYWNKEQFAEAGLDPEAPPTSWEQLKAHATRLTRRGSAGLERIGFHTQEGQSTVHTFAWQNGGSFQSADGKTATLPLVPNQEALQWLASLMADVGGWPAAARLQDSWGMGASHPFLTGQLPMLYEVDNWAGEMVARHRPEMAFGVAPPPTKNSEDRPLTWSGGYSYVISRDVPHPDTGWELIRWLVSDEGWTAAYEGDAARAKAMGGVYLPGMTGQPALDARTYAKYKTGLPSLDKVPEVAASLMPHTRFRELSIAAADLWDGVMQAQREAVSQVKSAAQALEDNNALVQRALDQGWIFAPNDVPGRSSLAAPRSR